MSYFLHEATQRLREVGLAEIADEFGRGEVEMAKALEALNATPEADSRARIRYQLAAELEYADVSRERSYELLPVIEFSAEAALPFDDHTISAFQMATWIVRAIWPDPRFAGVTVSPLAALRYVEPAEDERVVTRQDLVKLRCLERGFAAHHPHIDADPEFILQVRRTMVRQVAQVVVEADRP